MRSTNGVRGAGPKWSGGSPKTIGDRIRDRICLIARTSPSDWGITAFSAWSLSTLGACILQAGGMPWQTTTTWKASTDPDFIAKMHRVLDLYDHPPDDGRIICVDEFGPLNLLPHKGNPGVRSAGRKGCVPPATATTA